ncbi:ATP-binding protein [Paramagnetospirillum magneticum]|uniref:histidine kinase n=1 Tax=Paramagnetospirillum magneticum (strain ATCC 700264 / AMB-1) TaxID=342108 RepID=Q2W2C6_PARM1|nr:ATP-binding protein [Paramagnetospirillum magneticum]BAE51999.1 Signal transduction histidine kinase [Paramagnetospirillum magneticum AMB-1]
MGADDASIDTRVRAEQVRVLARNLPFTALTGTAIALLAALGAAPVAGEMVWWWAGAFVAVAALRLAMLRFYWTVADRDRRPDFWGPYMAFNLLLSGLMWLIFGLAAFDAHDAGHALFIAVILTGLTAASLASLSAYFPGQMAFALPTIAGFVIPVALSGERVMTILAVMAAVFLVVVTLSCRAAERVLVQSIRLRFENERLIGDLRRAGAEAEAANRAKSDFLAVMSHELRTPIASILGFVQLAGMAPTLARARAILPKVGRAGRHLLAIVDDILDISRIEAGKYALDLAPFSLDEMLGHVEDLTRPLAEEKGVELSLQHSDDAPALLVGDALRLGQILINLVGNAVKFTSRGAVHVTVRTMPIDEISLLLECEVADSGIGIPADRLEAIFEPFTQGDGSTTRRYGGTGLGLSVCRTLVEMMGGEITVESQPGRGSVFRFSALLGVAGAPQAQTEATESEPALSPDFKALAGRRVLLAEDNPQLAEIYSEFLGMNGIQVIRVENGAQVVPCALDPARRPDLILMDMEMPQMSGLDATRAIRAHLSRDELPIIGLTAHAFASARDLCFAAGMNDQLVKPVDFHLLTRAIIRTLGAPPADAHG